MKRQGWLLATAGLAALAACSTGVEVDNMTPSLWRTADSVYEVRAVVASDDPALSVREVEVEAVGLSAPVVMERLDEGLFAAPLALDRCVESVRYRYLVRLEGRDGRVRESVVAPEEDRFEVPIQGPLPGDCEGLEDFFITHITVNDQQDAVDDAPGDGVCSTGEARADGPVCSLRAAIMEANARPGQDLIIVPAGTYPLTLQDAEGLEADGSPRAEVGDLDITGRLTLLGIGDPRGGIRQVPIVDGAAQSRVFEIHSNPDASEDVGPRVEMRLLRVSNGRTIAAPGAGILNRGALRLDLVRVDDNHLVETLLPPGASRRPGGGAGVANFGRLVVTRSIIAGNRTALDRVERPDAEASIDLETTDPSDVEEAVGPRPVVAPPRGGRAGGVYNFAGAYAEIDQSLIAGNAAPWGGGLYNATGGHLRLSNVTVGENEAGVSGGGLDNRGEAVLNSVTLAFNRALDPRGVGGIRTEGRLRLTNSIVSGNGPDPNDDCAGAIESSGGGNALGRGNDCRVLAARGSDRLAGHYAIDRTLGRNDGYVPTYALQFGAGAAGETLIDQGSEAEACLSQDQRSKARPRDGDGDGEKRCDPGAFEH